MAESGVNGNGAARSSVQVQPRYEELPRSGLVLSLASIADDIAPWGFNTQLRDRQLREFWPTEPTLASAIYNTVARDVSFSWTLEGPPRTVNAVHGMFHEADLGGGWLQFGSRWLTDYLTCDNGAFIEIIRSGEGPSSPVIGFAHLDSGRCRRTGVPEWPVVYTDRLGREHRLKPHQVIARAEFPSPVETMNGVGLSAVSRVLRAAQLMKDIGIYRREKVSGRNPMAIHIVTGVGAEEISDAVEQHQQAATAKGLLRYILPVVIGTIDPTAPVSKETIELASLPDGWSLDDEMRWYINALALALGADYQDFAPLPGRGLGTGAQSLVLHMKSRGKGPALFIKTMEHLFNFHGVIPQNVIFRFDEQDTAADAEQVELGKQAAERDAVRITSGVLTPAAVRQQMLDNGQISQEIFDGLQEAEDLTSDQTVNDEEPGAGATTKEAEGVSPFAEEERLAWEAEMAGDMSRALASMFREVKAAIGGSKGLLRVKARPEDLLDDASFWERFRQAMVEPMSRWVRVVARGGAEAASERFGLFVDMDLINERVLDYSRTYLTDWWREIDEVTRRNLRKAVVNWQEGGLGNRGLPDLVESIEPMFGRSRAEAIASTEVTRAFWEGNKLAYEQAGVAEVEWQTSRDAVVCPTCAPLNGKRWPLSSPAMTPPAHVRCRCALIASVPERRFGVASPGRPAGGA